MQRQTAKQKYSQPTSAGAFGRWRSRLTTTIAASLVALSSFAIVLAGSTPASAWGPTRQTFTMNDPADYVTFNSITDDPSWGDERGFTLIKDVTGQANDANAASSGNFQEVATAEDGHTYMVKVFVHNNAAANLNLVAKNTRLMAYLPTASGDSAMIQAMLAADNCGANTAGATGSPCVFWDEAYIKSDDENDTFKVSLVDGSLRYYNNIRGATNDESFTFDNDEDLLTDKGVQVGYEQMDGNVPGCFQYSGYFTFLVNVTEDPASFTLTKQFRVNGGEWTHTGTANPGDTIEYAVGYANVGETKQEHVIIRDTLAKNISILNDQQTDNEFTGNTALDQNAIGLNYVAGSTYLRNATYPDKPGFHVTNDEWTTKGLDIGSYEKDSNAYVYYTVKVPDEEQLQCGQNIFENTVIATTADGSKLATTQVSVNRDCSDTPDPIVPGEEHPGAPEAGTGVKTAVISLVAFMICGAVLVRVLVKRRNNVKQ